MTALAPPSPRRDRLRADVQASLVVFLVAVPFSLGIAVASDAPIVAGIIAAAVGGVVAGLLGGAPLQVSGPAAGLTAVVADLVLQFGWRVTCLITVLAGLLQILLGLSRVARTALAISPAIVHAMLAGIGVTIVLGQLHVLLGGSAQSSAVENVRELPGQLSRLDSGAALAGLATIAILVAWPRLGPRLKAVPAPLVAVVLVTAVAAAVSLSAPRVDMPDSLLGAVALPELPDGKWGALAIAVVTVALVASVESLLSAVAVDRMHDGKRADLDRELLGQGAANATSGLLGGLPVTGVIVRSSTNVAAGARTRASAVLHGVWVLAFALFFGALVEQIPLAALAGLLVVIGARLVDVHHIRTVARHRELPIYVATIVGVITLNLLEGVLIGIAVAIVMALRRTIRSTTHVEREGDEDGGPGRWRVSVEGALSFLSLPRLTRQLAAVPAGADVRLELVVDYLDHAAYEQLAGWVENHRRTGGSVLVDEVGAPLYRRSRDGHPVTDKVGSPPRFLAPWSAWQERAWSHLHDDPQERPARSGTPSDRVLRGIGEFHTRTAPLIADVMTDLAAGQHPSTMFVTCADSRVVPNLITSSGPGDLFTVRNVGNLVPTWDLARQAVTGGSVAAATEYAVDTLRVDTIVVCGHSGCGAMGALVDRAHGGSAGAALDTWLAHAEPSRHRPAPAGDRCDTDLLAMANVQQQLDHLRGYPAVARALAEGRITLMGMFFDIAAARTLVLDEAAGEFRQQPATAGRPVPVAKAGSGALQVAAP